MKRLLLAVTMTLLPAGGAALAGPFEDGDAAHQSGRYAEAPEKSSSAAGQGDARAHYSLGRMYGDGQGVARCYVRSSLWFDLARSGGNLVAEISRDRAARKMTPEQIAESGQLVRECARRNFRDCR
jgi:TPR repeat protein